MVIRPAYTLEGTGGGLVYNVEDLRIVGSGGLAASLVGQVLVVKIQFAHDSGTSRVVIIEIAPPTSRSEALASEATEFPIALISAKLAGGLMLGETPHWREGTLEKYTPSGRLCSDEVRLRDRWNCLSPQGRLRWGAVLAGVPCGDNCYRLIPSTDLPSGALHPAGSG